MSNKWIQIDANKESFGRLATRVAFMLQGKDSPDYDPSKIQAPNVVVINCQGLKIGERRGVSKYYTHSGYLGNLKEHQFTDKTNGERFKNAVNNMLPKNKSRKNIIGHLKCYEDDEHPHKGQIQ